jgi:hypothetical protein
MPAVKISPSTARHRFKFPLNVPPAFSQRITAMRRFLLGSAVVFSALWFGDVPSFAQAEQNTTHITATGATGSSPVLLNSSTAFSVLESSGSQTNAPVTLIFAVPAFATINPSITSAGLGAATTGIPVSAIIPLGIDTTQALYAFAGCPTRDPSITISNMNNAEIADGPSGYAGGYNVFSFNLDQGFTATDQQINVVGLFGDGTIVVPLTTFGLIPFMFTIYDTSWVNAGFVNAPPPEVPEPVSMSVLGVGMAGLGYIRSRRRAAI